MTDKTGWIKGGLEIIEFLHFPIRTGFIIGEEEGTADGGCATGFAAIILSTAFSLCVDGYNALTNTKLDDQCIIRNNLSKHDNHRTLDWITRLTSPAGYLYFNMASDDLTTMYNSEGDHNLDVHVWGDDVIYFKEGEGYAYDTTLHQDMKFMIGERWCEPERYKIVDGENKKIQSLEEDITRLEERTAELYSEGKIGKAKDKEGKLAERRTELREYTVQFNHHKKMAFDKIQETVERLNENYEATGGQDE